MGVCAQQHRVSTGRYNSFILKLCVTNRKIVDDLSVSKTLKIFFSTFGLILYMYILLLILALCIEISLKQPYFRSYPMKFSFYLPASEISPTIIPNNLNNILRELPELLNNRCIILIFHLFKTTKNTNLKTL